MAQSINPLTSRLWVTQSEFYFTNSGIFLDGNQACLIDPGVYPAEIAAIGSFVREQNSDLQTIILTHCHWDHILGPEYFPGVQIISQASYLQNPGGKIETRICRQVAEWETQEKIKRKKPFIIPVPDKTFNQRFSLSVGNLSLELIHAPGHAAEQLVIYQPEQCVLWAADMLSDIDIPYVSDNLAAYEHTVELLSGLEIEVLIPGHGKVTLDKKEICTRMFREKNYLAELRDKVERIIQEGKTIKEAVDSCMDMQYLFQEENERPHRLNVESVYLELGGEGDSSKMGWDQFLYEL